MHAPCKLFDSCAEVDQEPHFIRLNQTSIGAAPFLFYTVISVEVLVCFLSILLFPFLCFSVLRAVVIHRNFRYQICLASLYNVLSLSGRLGMLPYQLLDWPISANDLFVFICDLLRDLVMGYCCSLLGSFAIERTIATHFWKWYELASPSTLLVLIGAELFFLIPLTIGGSLTLLSIVSINSNIIVYTILFIISTSLFLHTYFSNVAIMTRMERGAAVGDYFVSKRFQVRENVLVMKYMFRITLVPSCLAVPAFLCFAFKLYGPAEWLVARNIAFAFFDLLIASASLSFMVSVVLSNATVRGEFKKLTIVQFLMDNNRKKRRQSLDTVSDRTKTKNITEIYFSQLAHSWTSSKL